MSLVLQSKPVMVYTPHPQGIYPAVCLDVIDLGLMPSASNGRRRMVNKVRVYFETELLNDEGKHYVLARTFTASLHPKAKLNDFLAKWRGRPIAENESIDLSRIIGVSCTLVLSHKTRDDGSIGVAIDAVSKPTRKVTPSGGYDPAVARQQVAEWKAALGLGVASPNARPAATTAGPVRIAVSDDIGF